MAQALHQAAAGTLKPANRVQAPVAAVKNWQLPQFEPGLKVGSLVLLASATYFRATACALSAGSGLSAWACALPMTPEATKGSAAVATTAWIRKRRRDGFWLVMGLLGWLRTIPTAGVQCRPAR